MADLIEPHNPTRFLWSTLHTGRGLLAFDTAATSLFSCQTIPTADKKWTVWLLAMGDKRSRRRVFTVFGVPTRILAGSRDLLLDRAVASAPRFIQRMVLVLTSLGNVDKRIFRAIAMVSIDMGVSRFRAASVFVSVLDRKTCSRLVRISPPSIAASALLEPPPFAAGLTWEGWEEKEVLTTAWLPAWSRRQ